jgi:hypothetical protein
MKNGTLTVGDVGCGVPTKIVSIGFDIINGCVILTGGLIIVVGRGV